MVLNIAKYNIHPDKVDAYKAWVPKAVERILAIKGLVEFRGYRPTSGPWQIVSTTEYSDMPAWVAAMSSDEWNQIMAELRTYAVDVTIEVWGPSPITPKPLQPRR